jgi:HK97 family phage prohead protease
MKHLEFKADLQVDDGGLIKGIAWPFGTPDSYGDEIVPGAFKSAKAPLPLLFAHDTKQPLGAWDEITETAKGLTVGGKLLVDDVARAREIRAIVKAGGATGLSIGFVTKAAKAKKGGGRVITAVELVECSIVTVPAHPGARITSAKSAAAAIAMAEAIHRAAAALSIQR